jgi:Dockerin type I domain
MRRVEIGAGAQRALVRKWSEVPERRVSPVTTACILLASTAALALHAGGGSGSFGRPVQSTAPSLSRGVDEHAPARKQVESKMKFTRSMAVVLASAAAPCSGADLFVPKQYPTIQAAIDAAVDGDVIVIAAGIYRESVSIQGKTLSLVGAGAASTFVDGLGLGDGQPLLFYSNPAPQMPSSVSGICFRHGAANGVILQGLTSFTMRDCEIRSCNGTYGAALIPDGGNAVFERVTFRENSAVNGGAVNTNNGFAGFFESCVFVDNLASNQGSALIDFQSSSTLRSCQFSRNQGGAVIFSYIGSTTTVGDSSFCGNSGGSVGACCGGSIADIGGNSETPVCLSTCDGDVTRDGVVDARDLGAVLSSWGSVSTPPSAADVNQDGLVNGADLAAVLNAWGPCPQ